MAIELIRAIYLVLMAVFWDIAPCSPVDYATLQGAKSQKTTVFTLTAMRTCGVTEKRVKLLNNTFQKKKYFRRLYW
jgi:hypothetical protein